MFWNLLDLSIDLRFPMINIILLTPLQENKQYNHESPYTISHKQVPHSSYPVENKIENLCIYSQADIDQYSHQESKIPTFQNFLPSNVLG